MVLKREGGCDFHIFEGTTEMVLNIPPPLPPPQWLVLLPRLGKISYHFDESRILYSTNQYLYAK